MLYAVTLLLAQAQDGNPPAQGQPQGDPFTFLLPMILIFAAFYFIMILPARRREKQQRESLFSALKKNDEVLTSAGIIGTVANIKDDEVTLKVDESANARLRVLKSTIVKILNPKEPAGTTGDAAKGEQSTAKG